MKTYAIICLVRGRRFSYHAKDYQEAVRKARRFCRNNELNFSSGFKVKEILGHFQDDLKNELVSR